MLFYSNETLILKAINDMLYDMFDSNDILTIKALNDMLFYCNDILTLKVLNKQLSDLRVKISLLYCYGR